MGSRGCSTSCATCHCGTGLICPTSTRRTGTVTTHFTSLLSTTTFPWPERSSTPGLTSTKPETLATPRCTSPASGQYRHGEDLDREGCGSVRAERRGRSVYMRTASQSRRHLRLFGSSDEASAVAGSEDLVEGETRTIAPRGC